MFKLTYKENIDIDLFPHKNFLENLFYLEFLNETNPNDKNKDLLTYFYTKGIEYYSSISDDKMTNILTKKLTALYPIKKPIIEEEVGGKAKINNNPLKVDLRPKESFYKIKAQLIISDAENNSQKFIELLNLSLQEQEEKFKKKLKKKPKKIKFIGIDIDSDEASEVVTILSTRSYENKEISFNHPLLNPKLGKNVNSFQRVYTNLDAIKLINHCILEQYEAFTNEYIDELEQIQTEKLNNFLNFYSEQSELKILMENEVEEEQKNELKEMISNANQDLELANEEYDKRITEVKEEKLKLENVIKNMSDIDRVKDFICVRIEELLCKIIEGGEQK